MGQNLMRLVMLILGGLVGFIIAQILEDNGFASNERFLHYFPNQGGIALAFSLIGFIITPLVYSGLLHFNEWFLERLDSYPSSKLLGGVVGGFAGACVAVILISLFHLPEMLKNDTLYLLVLTVSLLCCTYLGAIVFSQLLSRNLGGETIIEQKVGRTKLLDTSVVIDGRIGDILNTGFLEGRLMIAQSVIQELQAVADSSDVLKRNRGRRGLEILNQLMENPQFDIEVYDDSQEDFEYLSANGQGLNVDARLVEIGKKLDADILTNDFNLKKAASLQHLTVLSLNDLTNALKPVVLPGEQLSINVLAYGKEMGQGKGYLEDGTMVVVEGGEDFIGQTINVKVTSILQTAQGRMIFAKPQLSRAGSAHD